MSAVPSGRKANPHGTHSPVATVSTWVGGVLPRGTPLDGVRQTPDQSSDDALGGGRNATYPTAATTATTTPVIHTYFLRLAIVPSRLVGSSSTSCRQLQVDVNGSL